MGAIGTALLTQLGATGVNELGKQAGYAIGNLTGYNDAIANDQLEQQKKLTDIQKNANFETMDKSQEMQMDFFNHTFGMQSKYDSAEEQVKRLKEAGLNPALMYSGGNAGGAGGTTGGAQGMAVSSGHASDESARKANDMQSQGMALQLAKLASEVEVNKSVAEVNKANAGLSGAKTTTEEQQRQSLVEKLTQEGIGKYLENVSEHWKITGEKESGLDYNGSGKGLNAVMSEKGFIGQEAVNLITKGLADIGNTNAQALLTNNKAQGYFQELVNETAKANAAGIQAAAMKLANEWNTGEFTNWKTWADLGVQATQVVGGVVTKGITAGKPAGAKVTHQYGDTHVYK